MDRLRTSWAGAIAVLSWAVATTSAWAESSPTASPAPSVAPLRAPQPPVAPLPHQLRPNDWPQPDYFTEALKLTQLQPGDRFKTLKLSAGREPALLVLPVQMQAFGWTPAFAAIIGARLDHEIDARGLDANRQTDLFDADGPYVRRFDVSQVTAFATAHSAARVLALYVGRDAAGKDFLTLTLRKGGGQPLLAHRSVEERTEPLAALQDIGAVLPSMLSELGLTGNAVAAAGPVRRCDPGDWNLDDPGPSSERATRACHALLQGVLLPEFEWPTVHYPRPRSPAKLAWLAEAYVEAEALTPPVAKAVRTIAWSQFELTDAFATIGGAVDVDDPVARPLARLLWARERNRHMPVRSRNDSAQEYAAAAAAALPPFAQVCYINLEAVEVVR